MTIRSGTEGGVVLAVGLRPEILALLKARLEPDVVVRGLAGLPPEEDDAATGRPPVAAISLEPDGPGALRAIARLAGLGTRVVALASTKDADAILKAMRAGADEFALLGEPAAIAAAIRAQLRPATGSSGGSVVTVFAAKGGAGATTIAVNLAATLQRRGRACIVDLDLNLGDVLAFLDVTGSYSIRDVTSNLARLDRQLLESSLPRHRCGLHVLSQTHRLEEGALDGAAIAELLAFLRREYDWVVVDGVRTFDEIPLAALDASDRILLVATQEIPAVRNARRCVEIFRKLGYADGRVQLLINRHQGRARVPDDAIAETIRLPIAARLCNDFAATSEAIHRGQLIAEAMPRSPLVRDLEALGPLVGAEATPGRQEPSMLKRFFSSRTVPHGAQ